MKQKPNFVILSGGFDPIHSGHIAMIQDARLMITPKYGTLAVGLNSDDWLARKKGRHFMPFSERFIIMNNIIGVDMVVRFNDGDDSAIDLIQKLGNIYHERYNIIFANGGDRTLDNIPEMNYNYSFPVKFEFGVGGTDKFTSSRDILKDWYEWKRNQEL